MLVTSEVPNEYYCVEARSPEGEESLLGLSCNGHGLAPEVFISPFAPERIFVASDQLITAVDLPVLRQARQVELDGLFFQFLSHDGRTIVAIHELGVAAFDTELALLWSRSTEMVTSFEVDENTLCLQFDVVDALSIDMKSGEDIR